MGQLKDLKADFVVSVGGGSPVDAAKAIIYKYQETPESGREVLAALWNTYHFERCRIYGITDLLCYYWKPC